MHAEINVTPLVDVCLVLLIIFMVVLPAVVNGVPVQLPRIADGTSLETRVLPVTIKNDGTVYLDTSVVRRDEVASALERLHANASARPIAVRADARVPYGDVAEILGMCRGAGWSEIALVGEREGQ